MLNYFTTGPIPVNATTLLVTVVRALVLVVGLVVRPRVVSGAAVVMGAVVGEAVVPRGFRSENKAFKCDEQSNSFSEKLFNCGLWVYEISTTWHNK